MDNEGVCLKGSECSKKGTVSPGFMQINTKGGESNMMEKGERDHGKVYGTDKFMGQSKDVPPVHVNDTSVPGALHNCTEGAVKNWTENKADWCCVNELLGCNFNCSAGYA